MKHDPQRARDGKRRNILAAAAALIGMSVGIAASVPTDASAQTPVPANKPYKSNYLKINTSNQDKKPSSNQIKKSTRLRIQRRGAAKPTTGKKPRGKIRG